MKIEEITAKFQNGIDCGQLVLSEHAKELGYSVEEMNKIGAAFGGGMGNGDCCGAVVGAMIILGLKYGNEKECDPSGKEKMNEKRAQFIEQFKKHYDGLNCREILGHDIAVPQEAKKIMEENLLMTRCPEVVNTVLEIISNL